MDIQKIYFLNCWIFRKHMYICIYQLNIIIMKNLNQIAKQIRKADNENDRLFISELSSGIAFVFFGIYIAYASKFIESIFYVLSK